MTRLLPHDALSSAGRAPGLRARVTAVIAAAVLLAPGTALGDAGSSTSAVTLLESIAGHSQQLAGLLDDTNRHMDRLEADLGEIKGLDAQMGLAAGVGRRPARDDPGDVGGLRLDLDRHERDGG